MTAPTPTTDPPLRRRAAESVHPLDLLGLTVLAVLIRLPGYLAAAHLTFDDGVFGASAIAMRHGGVPFREVFSSQGPLFLPVTWLGDLIGGRTLDSPRFASLASGLALTLIAYWTARAVTGRRGALVAGLLVATSGTIAWVTAPAAADGPALVFTLWAVGLAIRYHLRPTTRRAVLVGLAVGAALSIKAVESYVLVPVGIALAAPVVAGLRQRRLDRAGTGRALGAAASAVAVFVVSSVPFGWSLVWDQSVTYHSAARDGTHPIANTAKILSTLWDRDLVIYLVAAVWVISALVRGTASPDADWDAAETYDTDAGDPLRSGRALIVAWAISTVAWLAFVVSPMWRPHVSSVALALALLLSCWLPNRRVLAVCALVAIPVAGLQLHELLRPAGYSAQHREAIAALRALPRGALAISDDPGLIWRAGRRTTDDLVDTSVLRVEQHRYTTASIAAAAADPQVCAVVTTSSARFGSLKGLPTRLEAHGYVETTSWGSDRGIWLRRDCDTPDGSG